MKSQLFSRLNFKRWMNIGEGVCMHLNSDHSRNSLFGIFRLACLWPFHNPYHPGAAAKIISKTEKMYSNFNQGAQSFCASTFVQIPRSCCTTRRSSTGMVTIRPSAFGREATVDTTKTNVELSASFLISNNT